MAIVKMKKFTLLAFESQRAKLLEKLQSFAEVEFINLQDNDFLENNEDFKGLSKDGIQNMQSVKKNCLKLNLHLIS